MAVDDGKDAQVAAFLEEHHPTDVRGGEQVHGAAAARPHELRVRLGDGGAFLMHRPIAVAPKLSASGGAAPERVAWTGDLAHRGRAGGEACGARAIKCQICIIGRARSTDE